MHLIRVVAYSSLINQDITVHLAAEALEGYYSFQSSKNDYDTGYPADGWRILWSEA